jgi:uncharacterized protein
MTASHIAMIHATVGGLMIGLAAWLLLAALGRVAGISGIVASAVYARPGEQSGLSSSWRWAFVFGLMLGGYGMTRVYNVEAAASMSVPWAVLSGVLVGLGTVLGSGCTSGHGVCGLGRRSLRSTVATLVFMAVGMLVASILSTGQR